MLGEEGFISLTLAVDSMTGKVAGSPQISARGFSDDPSQFNAVLPLIDAELDKLAADGSPTRGSSRRACGGCSASGCPTPTAAAR